MDVLDQDYHNFSASSSSHKLPTISGTQAIRNVIQNTRPIPTSLPQLDATLGRTSSFGAGSGGLQRGVITEIFGPPGVGKTTFALQAAVNAIHAQSSGGSRVTWIDTSSQLVPDRLKGLAEAYRLPSEHDFPSSPPQPQGSKDSLLADKFNYLHVASLPKLLALFLHSTPNFPPPDTTLIVLDDISNLILSSLPRSTSSLAGRTSLKSPSAIRDEALARRALSRRFQVISGLASGLQKFAAANNVAILVTSKAAVNLRPGQKATLRPALTSQQWDNYLSTRIALYRDFWPHEAAPTQRSVDTEQQGPTEFERRSLRFARIIRLGGKLVSSSEVGFVIEEGGLREVLSNSEEVEKTILPMATQPLPALEDVLNPSLNHDNGDPASEVDNDESATGVDDVGNVHSKASHAAKRKAIEIADSEEEEEVFDISDDEPLQLPNASKENDFQPSSQVLRASQDDKQQVTSRSTNIHQPATAMKDNEYRSSPDLPSNPRQDVDREEMLLETYEVQPPPFSQAAAEMSEPLTPSDDGRDLS